MKERPSSPHFFYRMCSCFEGPHRDTTVECTIGVGSPGVYGPGYRHSSTSTGRRNGLGVAPTISIASRLVTSERFVKKGLLPVLHTAKKLGPLLRSGTVCNGIRYRYSYSRGWIEVGYCGDLRSTNDIRNPVTWLAG